MKALISLLIAVVVAFVGFKLYEHWNMANDQKLIEERAARQAVLDPDRLEGMPWQLYEKMREAQKAGPEAMRNFLEACKRFPDVKDPRLAWAELDYAVMISASDPVAARKVYQEVKKRTPPDSRIQPRLKQMAKSFE